MKKTVKVAGAILGIMAVILIGVTIFVKIYFTSAKMKGLILPYAEKALGRKVSVENININIFTGIEISGVNIQDNPAFRTAPFLTADEVVLKYALWPLLKKKLTINKLLVVKPHIFIERNEEGIFNFDDLKPESKTEPAGTAKQAQQKPASVSQAFVLTIAQIDVQDGEITLVDKTVQTSSPLLLKRITFTARDISMTSPFTLSLLAELPGSAKLSLAGQINPAAQNTNLQLKIDSLNLKTFSPYYHQLIPFEILSSRLSLQSRIKTTGAEKVQAEGKINLSELKTIYPALSPKEMDLSVNIDYALSADLIQHIFKIDRLALSEVPLLQVSASFTQAGKIEFNAVAPEIDLGQLKKAIPPLSKIIEEIDTSGKVLEFQFAGSVEEARPLIYSGKGRISDVQIIYRPIPSLVPHINGNFKVDQHKVQIPALEVTLPGSKTSLSGTLSDYLQKPDLNFEVKSQITDLAAVSQALAPLTPDLKEILTRVRTQGAVNVNASLSGNPFSSLRYQGEAVLHKIKIQYLPYPSLSPQIEGRVTFNEKEVAVHDLSTYVSRSDLTLKGRIVDYRKTPAIYMDVTSRHLSIDKLLDAVQALTPASPQPPAKVKEKPAGQDGIDFGGVSAQGKVHLADVSYKTIALRDLNMSYSLQDNVFRWQNLKVKVAPKGTVAMDGRVNFSKTDFSKTSYSSKIGLQSVSISEQLSAFAPEVASIFSGRISADVDLAGEGISKEKIQEDLNLKGKFELADAKIQNTEVGKSLSALLPVVNWSDLRFKTVKGDVSIEKGKIHLNSALIRDDYILEPKGTIGLDSSLNLDITARISPQISEKNKLRYLTDDQGWTVVPIKVGGTLTRPVLKIDLKAVQKNIEEELEEKLKKKLEEKLKKKFKNQLFEKLKLLK